MAIATALMPPLCTAGYGLATLQMNYFLGAFYLFVINSIYIAFATFIGVKLMKYKGVPAADNDRAVRVRRIVYSLAVLTICRAYTLRIICFATANSRLRPPRFVQEECSFPDTQVLSRKAYAKDGVKYLTITLIGRTLPADSLRLALESRLKFYGLAGTRLSFIQGGDGMSSGDKLSAPGVGDILSDSPKYYHTAADNHRLAPHPPRRFAPVGD